MKIVRCNDIQEVIKLAEDLGYDGYAYDEILNALSKSIMGRNID